MIMVRSLKRWGWRKAVLIRPRAAQGNQRTKWSLALRLLQARRRGIVGITMNWWSVSQYPPSPGARHDQNSHQLACLTSTYRPLSQTQRLPNREYESMITKHLHMVQLGTCMSSQCTCTYACLPVLSICA